MSSVVQDGWDRVTINYITTIALTLLYYDYVLTLDRERRLVWSRCSFQWGTILFFLNRYCGVIGHALVLIQKFAQSNSPLYHFCKPLYLYHQILAVVMQAIIGLAFVTRTYALYDRSRTVLIGLVSLAFSGIAFGSYMLSQAQRKATPVAPVPEGTIGCWGYLSWSQSWRLAAAWSTVMIFDLIVVVMTLVRTIKINRRSGKKHALTRVLMRDGVVYFGVISLAMLSNIITFLCGSEVTRGSPTTATNVLASVMVSRLMLNLREQGERSATTTLTAGTNSAQMSTTSLRTLTNIEEADEAEIYEVPNHQEDVEMVQIVDRSKTENPAEHRV